MMMNEDLEKQIKMKILEQLMGDMDEEQYSKVAGMSGGSDENSLPMKEKADVADFGDKGEMGDMVSKDADSVESLAGGSPVDNGDGDSGPLDVSPNSDSADEEDDFAYSPLMQRLKKNKAMKG
jgi:hypothetical protein